MSRPSFKDIILGFIFLLLLAPVLAAAAIGLVWILAYFGVRVLPVLASFERIC